MTRHQLIKERRERERGRGREKRKRGKKRERKGKDRMTPEYSGTPTGNDDSFFFQPRDLSRHTVGQTFSFLSPDRY